MFRKASLSDIDEIMKIPNVNSTKQELRQYLKDGEKFLYVYLDKNQIVNATFFGSDDVDDDEYDSEVYGIYTKDIDKKDEINKEVLNEAKKALFDKGYRRLIIWCDEDNNAMRKFLEKSGGLESRSRQKNDKLQVAYAYTLDY